MPDNQEDNPYAFHGIAEGSHCRWADGDVLFSNDEISVAGDVRLPRLCIHTGKTNGLVRKDQKLSAVPHWIESANDVLICGLIMSGFWSAQVDVFFWPLLLSIAGLTTMIFVVRMCARTIRVQSYVCRIPDRPRERLQMLLVAGPILCGLIGIAGYILTDNQWWFALPVVASIARAQADRIGTIRFHDHRNGRFILRGHSTAFAGAWAKRVELAGRESSQKTQLP